jgi:hypothetical protein
MSCCQQRSSFGKRSLPGRSSPSCTTLAWEGRNGLPPGLCLHLWMLAYTSSSPTGCEHMPAWSLWALQCTARCLQCTRCDSRASTSSVSEISLYLLGCAYGLHIFSSLQLLCILVFLDSTLLKIDILVDGWEQCKLFTLLMFSLSSSTDATGCAANLSLRNKCEILETITHAG